MTTKLKSFLSSAMNWFPTVAMVVSALIYAVIRDWETFYFCAAAAWFANESRWQRDNYDR